MKKQDFSSKSSCPSVAQAPQTKDDFIKELKHKAKEKDFLAINTFVNNIKIDIYNKSTSIGIVFSDKLMEGTLGEYRIFYYPIDSSNLKKCKREISKLLMNKAKVKSNPQVNPKSTATNCIATKDEAFKEVKAEAEAFVFNNHIEFDGKCLLNPVLVDSEKKSIAYLKEKKAKEIILPLEDERLINTTAERQNRNFILMSFDTEENYKYSIKIEKELLDLGTILLNYNNYVVTIDRTKKLYEQVQDLKNIIYIIDDKLEKKGLISGYKSDDTQLFYRSKKYILFSVRNLGYDLTEEEYIENPNILQNDFIVQCAKYMGYGVRFMFREDIPRTDKVNHNDIHSDSDEPDDLC